MIRIAQPAPRVDLEEYKRRVFSTIRRHRLVEMGVVVYVAVSGGKDSCAALALLKMYVEESRIDAVVKAFHINLGFGYSARVEEVAKAQADALGVELRVVNALDYLDILKAAKAAGRPVCSVCGALKRYLMNKVPRELGATKVATGHHMYDFLSYYFRNLAGGHYQWNFKIVPRVEGAGPLLTKIRPLIYARPEENEAFCRRLGLSFNEVCCEFGLCGAAHLEVYEMMKAARRRDPDFDLRLMRGVVEFNLRHGVRPADVKRCKICGEPASGEVCAVCKLRAIVNRA
ncbi:MAG: ATP-binding protein [Pyrobaculum sp.]